LIDVFVPMLGRTECVPGLVSSFRANSSQMDEIHFICSPGTPEIDVCAETGEDVIVTDWKPGKGDYARKMNLAFHLTSRPFVFLGSSDIEFRSGWSEAALGFSEVADVIATNDLANAQVKRGQFGTHCLVRRDYVDRQGGSADGGFMHTGYDHNFVDRELCHLAQYRGVFAFARDSHVAHRHPHWRTAPWDDTYKKGMRNFQQDRRLFLSRAHLWNYVGLSSQEQQVARREQSTSRS
jgi:hypothetical protein